MIEAVPKTKQGEVCPEVIEWLEGYQVIRFINKEGEDFIIESVFIPKRNFGDWFWEKSSKIPGRTAKGSLLGKALEIRVNF